MSTSAVVSVQVTPEFSGLLRRAAAYIVDFAVLLGLLFVVGFLLRGLRLMGIWHTSPLPPEQLWLSLGVGAKLLIVTACCVSQGPFYFILFHSSAWQATIGKRLLAIRVTDNGGNRVTAGRAFLRWLVLELLGPFDLVVSLFSIAFTSRKKALHDFIANTVVLQGRPTPDAGIEPSRAFAGLGITFLWIFFTFLITL